MFNQTAIKTELSNLMNLTNDELKEIRKDAKNHSILCWKVIKEKYNANNRFRHLLRFVHALYSIPYANGDVERSSSNLKLIKSEP